MESHNATVAAKHDRVWQNKTISKQFEKYKKIFKTWNSGGLIVITKILQITSKLTELLDSQVPDSSHDFDPIKQVDDEEDDDVDDVTNMIGVPSIHPHQGQKK